MHFYRPVQPIAAFTFDLDDTLYDNGPVIRSAVDAHIEWLVKKDAKVAAWDEPAWVACRQRVLERNPDLYHDVTELRKATLTQGLRQLGVVENKIPSLVEGAFRVFIEHRSRIVVPKETHDVLSRLSKLVPLVSISNGNVNLRSLGIAQYFTHQLFAGVDGYAKPAPDLFMKASQLLTMPPKQIWHVGDNPWTDVQGALSNGLNAIWLDVKGRDPQEHPLMRHPPNVSIEKLTDLLQLESFIIPNQ